MPPRELRPRTLALARGPVVVPVRESPRARRLRLVVDAAGRPRAVVPRRVPEAAVDAFLEAQRAWLERQLAWEPRLGLDRPGVVWLGGEAHPAPAGVAPEAWYRRRARERIGAAVEREAAAHGFRYARIAIRDTRSRWGSCSTSGTLSFSWRLVLAPPEVLDYVVVHELCHLREPDHSPRFWALVESLRPGWREPAAWLREHGRELQAYEPLAARSRRPADAAEAR